MDAQLDLDGGAPDLGPIFEEFCRVRLTLLLTGARDCCPLAPPRTGSLDDEEVRGLCASLADDPALRDGSIQWDEAEASRYLASLESALPGCAFRDRSWNYGEVLRGTRGEDEDCTPARLFFESVGIYQCAEGLRCEVSGTTEEYVGTCRPLGELGDSCYHDCEPGLFCSWALPEGDDPFWGICQTQDDSLECTSDHACSSLLCRSNACSEADAAQTWCTVLG